MILDVLHNMNRYARLGKHYQTAIDFLQQTDLQQLQSGKIDIDGECVFAFVSDTDLLEENRTWELHKRYTDIQLVLDGQERMGYTRTADLSVVSENGDCCLFTGKAEETVLHLTRNMFAIFFPLELHRPGCPVGERSHSKKLVIKVLDNHQEDSLSL